MKTTGTLFSLWVTTCCLHCCHHVSVIWDKWGRGLEGKADWGVSIKALGDCWKVCTFRDDLPLAGDYWGRVLLTGSPGLQRNLPIHYHCWHDRYLLCISIKDGCDLDAYYIMTPFIISRKPIRRLLWGLNSHTIDRSSVSHVQENLYNDSRCNIYIWKYLLYVVIVCIIIHTITRNTTFYGKAEEVFRNFDTGWSPKNVLQNFMENVIFTFFNQNQQWLSW